MIVRSIIDLAHNLGVKVVAEGVEDEATMDLLVDYGCDDAQGYLFSRPLAGVALVPWLESSAFGLQSTLGVPAASSAVAVGSPLKLVRGGDQSRPALRELKR